MQTTTNLGLKKPEDTDPIEIQDLNDNADIIDREMAKKAEKTGDGSDMTAKFSQVTTLANLVSGEKLTTSLGKVMKAISDLSSHLTNKSNPHGATKAQVGLGNVDNTSDANKPVSTAQQAALNTKVTATGGDIANTKVGSITASTASYPVPAANDTMKVFGGKIAKFFGDIRNWMTGVCLIGQIVNNCVTNNAGLPLSAAQGKALMDLYTVLNAKLTELNSDKAAANHKHDDRYYTKAEVGASLSVINESYQSLSLNYTNKYIEGNVWSYIGPSGINLSPGRWLITYHIHVNGKGSMSCALRSTINTQHITSIVTVAGVIISAELTEIVETGQILNLYPQFYSPNAHTFTYIRVEVICVHLK